MTIDELRANLAEATQALGGRFAAAELRVFGSVARGEAGPDSDIDLLVTFAQTPELQQGLDLSDYLSDRLQCSVDLVEPRRLKWVLRERVLEEAKIVCAA